LRGLALLDQAVALDKDFAPALALGSFFNGWVSLWAGDQRERLRRACLTLGRRALAVGGDDAEVLAWVVAIFVLIGEDIGPLDAIADRALALNPGLSFAWLASGLAKLCAGRSALALEHLETGLRLDPRTPWRPEFQVFVGDCLFMLGRFSEAAPFFEEAVQRQPGPNGPSVMLAACWAHFGRTDEARRLITPASADLLGLVMGWFRDPSDRERLRAGLALAGADV